jgi:transcriptional regulator with XRE-family HTH domain
VKDEKENEKKELKKLGKTIEKLYVLKYKTQSEFAIAAECSPEYMNRVIKGKKNPSYTKLLKMANALDVSLDDLRQ